MKKKRKEIIRVIVAMLTFWIVGNVLSEILALGLQQSSLEGENLRLAYEWGSSLLTIVVAFPCFLVVVRGFGLLNRFSMKPQEKISGKEHAINICAAVVPVFILAGIEAFLIAQDMVAVEEVVSVEASYLVKELVTGCLFMPVIEEIMFRGVILFLLLPYGTRMAVVVTTLLFVLGHGNPVNMLLSIVPGVVFAKTAIKTNGIFYGMIYHMVVNLTGKVMIPIILNGMFL